MSDYPKKVEFITEWGFDPVQFAISLGLRPRGAVLYHVGSAVDNTENPSSGTHSEGEDSHPDEAVE